MYETIRGWITRSGLVNKAEVAGRDDWMVDMSGPMLSDEVDEQAWLAERIRTKPQGEMRAPAAGPVWRPDDYAEMSEGRAVGVPVGGVSVSEEAARARLREAMSFSSAPIAVSARPDPWDLRGDRVVVPEEVSMEVVPVEEVALDALVVVASQEAVAMVPVLETALGAMEAASIAERVAAVLLARPKPDVARAEALEAHAADLRSRKPAGVTDVDDDDEEEEPEPKPLADKPVEPPYRPKYDDWGFPIAYPPEGKPAAGSEPPQPKGEPAPEEKPPASPPTGELGPGGSAGPAGLPLGAGSPEPIKEGTMNTRVQLTERRDGQYVKGAAANFEVEGATPAEVRAVLGVIEEIAKARHQAAVGAGTARAKGGVRTRIQLQPKPTLLVEGRRTKGEPEAGAGFENLNAPGMSVAEVEPLVDHQLALHYGLRRGEAAALVRIWEAFAGKGPAGPAEGEARKDERADATGDSPALLLPDAVGKGYTKRLHLGMCCVVRGGGLVVESLWKDEGQAKRAAARTGARVVDAAGFLVPQAEVDAAGAEMNEVQL